MLDANTPPRPRAKFRAMDEGTKEDWQIIAGEFIPFAQKGGQRILDHLALLKEDNGGFPVDRYEHSLQTASRAHQDGRDEEYVVCALLHDIGDLLGAFHHPDIAASIIRPFVSEAHHWMVAHHGVFQGYYYFDYLGLDKNRREAFRGNDHFDLTAEFCEKYDQKAFDPNYETLPIEVFEPMVMKVFQAPKNATMPA